MNTTGLKIRKLCELRNYTQEYMADRLGIVQNTYSRYETGEIDIKLSQLRSIAEVLDVPVEELLRPDPIVINMSHNEQANGVVHSLSNVPHDLIEKLTERYEKHLVELSQSNERMMAMIAQLIKQKGE